MLRLPLPAAFPAETPTPSPSPAPGGSTVLTWGQTLAALLIIAGMITVIGLILWGASAAKGVMGSVARSWIALALTAGLLAVGVLAFAVNDSTTRSTLIGALGAAVGAATAFYFSSKSTDQAHDLLTTSVGTETVPDLTGRTADDAMRVLSTTTLRLMVDPTSPAPAAGKNVVKQQPLAGAVAPKGTTVLVTYG
ncbi:PASTA domain-containing protein [Kitasatospora aureofaciens]|uniref:PASTA domain-containing protein n=1 Tax=Kitasatospora aureofaciens TaxID=1894 RepID=UPI000996F90B|nr:PASTA domain-containing protein [Kitasatospora aureofaciens]